MAGICSVEGCGCEQRAKGLCGRHYARQRRHDGLLKRQTCTYQGCMTVQARHGLCQMHAYRQEKGQPMDAPKYSLRKSKYDGMSCKADGCKESPTSAGYCTFHYDRQRVGKPLNHPKYKHTFDGQITGRHMDKKGYVILHVSGRRDVREHRDVMEQHLERPLLRHEEVHHLNGDRADNRIENLELWSKSHPSGQRVVDIVEFWCDFVAVYADMIDRPVIDKIKVRVLSALEETP